MKYYKTRDDLKRYKVLRFNHCIQLQQDLNYQICYFKFYNNDNYFNNKKGFSILNHDGTKEYYLNNERYKLNFKSNKEWRKYVKLLAFQ